MRSNGEATRYGWTILIRSRQADIRLNDGFHFNVTVRFVLTKSESNYFLATVVQLIG